MSDQVLIRKLHSAHVTCKTQLWHIYGHIQKFPKWDDNETYASYLCFGLCCLLKAAHSSLFNRSSILPLAGSTNGTYFLVSCVDGHQLFLNIMGILEIMPPQQQFHSQKPEKIMMGWISSVRMVAGPHPWFLWPNNAALTHQCASTLSWWINQSWFH